MQGPAVSAAVSKEHAVVAYTSCDRQNQNAESPPQQTERRRTHLSQRNGFLDIPRDVGRMLCLHFECCVVDGKKLANLSVFSRACHMSCKTTVSSVRFISCGEAGGFDKEEEEAVGTGRSFKVGLVPQRPDVPTL